MLGRSLRLALLLGTVVALALPAAAAAVPIGTGTDAQGRSYALGQVLVKLKPVPAATNGLMPGLQLSHTFAAGSGGATVMSEDSSEPMRLYTLEDRTQNVEETVKKLRALPGVEWASPNYVKRLYMPVSGESADDADRTQSTARKLAATSPAKLAFRAPFYVNDKLFGQQWHLGQIDAPGAWAYSQGSKTSKLCIIDSGMQKGHPDLPTPLKGWNTRPILSSKRPGELKFPAKGTAAYTDYYEKEPSADCGTECSGSRGHGTLVTGVAAAVGNNKLGVAGVAFKAGLLVCRVMDADDPLIILNTSIYRCIDLCLEEGAKVINISLGGEGYGDEDLEAFQKATKAGVLVVIAAGDGSKNFAKLPTPARDYPAGFAHTSFKMNNIITVAALNRDGKLTGQSNYGSNVVHMAAPGYAMSTNLNNSYTALVGTNAAAPMVSAAAALLFAAAEARGKRVTYLDVKRALLRSVDPFPNGKTYVATGGRLNVARAMHLLLFGTKEAPSPPPSRSPFNGTVVIEKYAGQRWKHLIETASYYNPVLLPYDKCIKACSNNIKCGRYVAFRGSPVEISGQTANCLLWSADAALCTRADCMATFDSPDVESGLVIRRPRAGYDARQSSTAVAAAATLAVDGNSTTFSSTLPQLNPWLVVDLRQAQEISAVRIILRRDAAYRLKSLLDLEVRLGTQALARNASTAIIKTLNVGCGYFKGQVGTLPGEPIVMVCQRPTVARYITLQIRGKRTRDVLSVAEVAPAW